MARLLDLSGVTKSRTGFDARGGRRYKKSAQSSQNLPGAVRVAAWWLQRPFGMLAPRRDLTQSELARRAGIRQASISKFESGRERPRPETYARILQAARVSPDVALQRYRNEVLDAVRRRRASNARVFAGGADADATDGDIGVLVSFAPDASLLDAAGLMLDLENILGTRIAVISDRAHGRIVDRAVAHAMPL